MLKFDLISLLSLIEEGQKPQIWLKHVFVVAFKEINQFSFGMATNNDHGSQSREGLYRPLHTITDKIQVHKFFHP